MPSLDTDGSDRQIVPTHHRDQAAFPHAAATGCKQSQTCSNETRVANIHAGDWTAPYTS